MRPAKPGGTQRGTAYDNAVVEITGVTEDVINGLYRLASLLAMTGFNHGQANSASTPGGTVPTTDTMSYDGGMCLATLPSASGGSGSAPHGWGLISHLERAVQLHLLSVPLEGVEYLREQATQTTAAGSGGPSIDLIVPNSAPRVLFSDGPLPITADVVDANEQYAGELLLWLKDGRLKALEYAWVTDEPPTTLPPLASIRVARRH